MVSVLVVDPASLQRLALRMLLNADPGLTVVGDAVSESQAVSMSATLRPDVVVMAGYPSKTEGIEAVRRLARLSHLPSAHEGAQIPVPRVLVLIPPGQEGFAYAALRAGASGFLLDDAAPDELVAAVRVVAAGHAVITPGLTRLLIDVVRRQPATHRLNESFGLGSLTAREREILVGVASGWSNAEIAERLSIAPTTVKTHVSNILAKIGVRARVQAVTYAYESGLIRPAA